ncbi:hypothetical protein BC6_00044 [Bacillus phage BC-6]|nr:hypothetical protein BC6_00044 [Bacillus phage BC-6]
MMYQVYRYDEEGKFLYDDMIEEVFDDNGNRILPEGCTDIAPPPLGTEPRFRDGAWHPTKEWTPPEPLPPEPTPLEILQKEVASLKEEVANLKGIQEASETISKLIEDVEAIKVIAEEAKNLPSLEPLEATLKSHSKRIGELDSTLQNTRYYIGVALPGYAHLFEN